MTGTTYLPGQSLAVVSDGLVVVAGDASLASELWQVTRAAGRIVHALDALGRRGFANMPDFACVQWDATSVNAVIRGDAFQVVVTTTDGEQVWDARGFATWIEHRAARSDGGRVTIRTDTEESGPELPLVDGVVLAARLDLVLSEVAEGRPIVPRETVEPAAPTPVAVPVEPPPVEAPVFETPAAAPAVEDEPHASETLVEANDSSLDELYEKSVLRRPEDAAVRVPDEVVVAAVPGLITDFSLGSTNGAAEVLGDHFGDTVAGVSRARPAQAAAVEAPAGPVATLVLSSGQRIDVAGPVYVGRSPSAHNTTVNSVPRLVSVDSPTSEISRTHVEFHVEDASLVARDVSSNGTLLQLPGQEPVRMPDRERLLVPIGSRLTIGDGVSIDVVAVG